MNDTLRSVLYAYDADVPPYSDCDPLLEECDALYYEILSVTNGTVNPPPGHVQPGPVGQFIFKPDPDFVGVAKRYKKSVQINKRPRCMGLCCQKESHWRG